MFTSAQWIEIRITLRVSHREIEVIRLAVAHESEQEIARDLSIAPATVHCHLQRIYRKLAISSRAELVQRVYEAHLNSLDD